MDYRKWNGDADDESLSAFDWVNNAQESMIETLILLEKLKETLPVNG